MEGIETTGRWRKASSSDSADDCVEVAPLVGGGTGIRDSKNRAGAVLVLPGPAWQRVLGAIQGGQFDD
jgi:hypothetical protein